MARMKGITPIISTIVLVLVMVALAGAAWSYIGGFTSAYTSKVIDLPIGSSYFDGKNVKIMLRNIGTSAINTGSCMTSGNTVTCGDITITREGSNNDADIRPSAASISPKGSVTITDYACESGNVRYRISSPSSTYDVNVNADTPCSYPADPVSWWKLDGDAKDGVGGNDGTGYGGVNLNYDDAIRKKVASFDGVDDYVNVPADTSLNPYTAFSIGLWVNIAAVGEVLIGTYGGNYRGFYLSGAGFVIGEGPTSNIWINCPIIINSWTHVAATYDGTNARCYINEILYSGPTAISAASWAGQALTMMKAPWYSSYVGGKIDDVMIFKRALSPEEINAIYNSQKK